MYKAVSSLSISRVLQCGMLLFASVASLSGLRSVALAQSGAPWAWGWNKYGQVGNGTTVDQWSPIQPTGLSNVVQIAGGLPQSLFLKSDGTVWACGGNDNGAVGDGTGAPQLTPVVIPNLTGMTQIAGGGYHSLALKADGTVWAWGYNGSGQLGDGTTTNRFAPVQVSGLTNVTQIAAGGRYDPPDSHSAALKSDGTVWTWGNNRTGQLGDGTLINRPTPVKVSGLTGIRYIACGIYHTLAIKSDGTLWAWGNNDNGELGDGTKLYRVTPVQVSNITGVVQVAGGFHTVALKSDGTVWAWGKNALGQVGDNSGQDQKLPVQVVKLSGMVQVVAAETSSGALKSDGTVWAWGENSGGRLGDGTTTNRSLPVQVITVKHQTYIAGHGAHNLSLQAPLQTTTLKPSNVSVGYGVPVTLTAKLTNRLGGVLINEPVVCTLDGASIGTVMTDASGTARVALSNQPALALGGHPFTVAYAGNRLYSAAVTKTSTLTITNSNTLVRAIAVTGRPGDTKNLVAIVKRKGDNAALSGKTTTFQIDGNTVGTGVTDGTGTATFAYTFDETYVVGAHTLTASYAGDSVNQPGSGTVALTVIQAPTAPVGNSMTAKAGQTVTLLAILGRTTDGSLLAGRTVGFKVNGVDLGTVVTDEDGFAMLDYAIPNDTAKGKYVITVTFTGDSFYLASSGNAWLRIK